MAGMRKKRVPTAVSSDDFFRDSDRVRSLFAGLINAHASSIAIIPSVSYGIAAAAKNVEIGAHEKIILLEGQFPSNVYAWRRAAEERNAELKVVGAGTDVGGRSRVWNERILDAIDARTAVVALPHVHWTDGTLFDLEQIAARARDVGAAVVVDGTQSVGALPFDVERVRPDALICAGYKWLFGPYGLGVAYFDERIHAGTPLEENWIGRLRSDEFSRLVDYESRYHPGAIRFDVGERSNFILVPMLAAALELVGSWGIENIQNYCHRLSKSFFEKVAELGYLVEESGRRSAHLFGIRMPEGVDATALTFELERRKISVSLRGNAIRVSPNVYNDERDVAELLDALHAAAGNPA